MKGESKKNEIDEVRDSACGTAATVMVSFRMPTPVKLKIAERAEELDISQTEFILQSVRESLKISKMIDAVREVLRKDPPPFAEEGWTPSQSECMTFIQKAVKNALDDKSDDLKGN